MRFVFAYITLYIAVKKLRLPSKSAPQSTGWWRWLVTLTQININTHLLGVGLHDLARQVVAVFRLHAGQLVGSVVVVGGLEGSAVLQRFLPGLVLLYQDHVVP